MARPKPEKKHTIIYEVSASHVVANWTPEQRAAEGIIEEVVCPFCTDECDLTCEAEEDY